MGSYCIAQRVQCGALWQPKGMGWGGKGEGVSRGRGHVYNYGWFMLMYGRNQHKKVSQVLCKKNKKGFGQTVKKKYIYFINQNK